MKKLRKTDKKISINLWVVRFRRLGKILFFLGKSVEGFLQVLVKKSDLIGKLKKINNGDLLKVRGFWQKKKDNEDDWELVLDDFFLLNKSASLPFLIEDNISINEDTKYRYRYLDLRRNISVQPIIIKSRFFFEARKFFVKEGFLEIETPLLSSFSPEGARCFLVSSFFPDRYYTLSQSPQIFKQLLMVSGLNKYFQIAKSFRQENARSDRQIEFLQLDFEQSFVSFKQLLNLITKFLKTVFLKIFPHLNVFFSQLTYAETIAKYGTEKPDLREKEKNNDFHFLFITDWPLFFWNKKEKKYTSFRHPFTAIKKKQINHFLNDQIKPEEVLTDSFDLVCNGEEILSGSLRIYQKELQEKVFSLLGYQEKEKKEHFGFFLQALDFAAPPHGGAGLGVDRLLAVILGRKSIKEFLSFPKNVDGSCSLTGTPKKIKI